MPRAERPAPLVLVATPSEDEVPFGSYRAVALEGQRRLAVDLSRRLGALGAVVVPLRSEAGAMAGGDGWGRWYAAAARAALSRSAERGAAPDTVGYAGAGALALLPDAALDELLSTVRGEVVANNRFSADAWTVAGDLDAALTALEVCDTDNAAPRTLEAAGFRSRDLAGAAWSRFDVDTPLDLALLRLSTHLRGARPLEASLRGWLEMARLPGDRRLEVPHLEAVGAVIRDRHAELVVAGRVPAATWAYLETETACRVRCYVEERGMRAARHAQPRSLLAALLRRSSAAELIAELAALGDALVLDTRVLMAALAGTSDARRWPPAEERYASDVADPSPIATGWLRELVEAAQTAPVPVVFGGHALVSDGLRIVTERAWLGH